MGGGDCNVDLSLCGAWRSSEVEVEVGAGRGRRMGTTADIYTGDSEGAVEMMEKVR